MRSVERVRMRGCDTYEDLGTAGVAESQDFR